jgi:hypothetical protein
MAKATDLTKELTPEKLKEMERARSMPTIFDEHCPEITPGASDKI